VVLLQRLIERSLCLFGLALARQRIPPEVVGNCSARMRLTDPRIIELHGGSNKESRVV
jgi:hypothetical protein